MAFPPVVLLKSAGTSGPIEKAFGWPLRNKLKAGHLAFWISFVSSCRLLNSQHFADDEAAGRQVNLCAPVVYERRSKCKLKTWESGIRRPAGHHRNTVADGFG